MCTHHLYFFLKYVERRILGTLGFSVIPYHWGIIGCWPCVRLVACQCCTLPLSPLTLIRISGGEWMDGPYHFLVLFKREEIVETVVLLSSSCVQPIWGLSPKLIFGTFNQRLEELSNTRIEWVLCLPQSIFKRWAGGKTEEKKCWRG